MILMCPFQPEIFPLFCGSKMPLLWPGKPDPFPFSLLLCSVAGMILEVLGCGNPSLEVSKCLRLQHRM